LPPVGPSAPVLYTTSDGGGSWSPQPLSAPADGWPPGSRYELAAPALAPDGRGQLLVTELVPWEYRQVILAHWVAATSDAGATWSPLRRLPDTPPGTSVHVSTSPADGSASWAWSTDELVTTRDGGARWSRLTLPPRWSVHRVQAVDARTAWVAVSVSDGHGTSHWRPFSTRDGDRKSTRLNSS